jgi:hypothetical protein
MINTIFLDNDHVLQLFKEHMKDNMLCIKQFGKPRFEIYKAFAEFLFAKTSGNLPALKEFFIPIE